MPFLNVTEENIAILHQANTNTQPLPKSWKKKALNLILSYLKYIRNTQNYQCLICTALYNHHNPHHCNQLFERLSCGKVREGSGIGVGSPLFHPSLSLCTSTFVHLLSSSVPCFFYSKHECLAQPAV